MGISGHRSSYLKFRAVDSANRTGCSSGHARWRWGRDCGAHFRIGVVSPCQFANRLNCSACISVSVGSSSLGLGAMVANPSLD